jgi:hypothetical protein
MTRTKIQKVTYIENYKSRRAFLALADDYEANLPSPSLNYPNIIFLFDEGLAVHGRELLFGQLNSLAVRNRQTLVVTDIGYGRVGFYLNFDELGAGSDGEDYDACIDAWGQDK